MRRVEKWWNENFSMLQFDELRNVWVQSQIIRCSNPDKVYFQRIFNPEEFSFRCHFYFHVQWIFIVDNFLFYTLLWLKKVIGRDLFNSLSVFYAIIGLFSLQHACDTRIVEFKEMKFSTHHRIQQRTSKIH